MHKPFAVLAALIVVFSVSSGAYADKGLLTGADIKTGSLTGANVADHSLGAALFTASAKASLAGDRGQRGLKGKTGTDGEAGSPGQVGYSGAEGIAGLGGVAGSNGAVGAIGPAGTTGLTGDAGIAGATGSTGATGGTGSVGPTGAVGSNGANGTDGTNGTNGTNGTVTPLFATAGVVVLPTASAPVTVIALNVPAGTYIVMAKSQLGHPGAGDSINCSLQTGSTTIDQISMKTLPALAAVPVALQAVVTIGSASQLSVQCAVAVASGTASFSSLIAIPTS